MEVSSTLHRLAWKAVTKTQPCRPVSSYRSISKPIEHISRNTSSRTFATTSQRRQDTPPPQPQPVSQDGGNQKDTMRVIPPRPGPILNPDPRKRVDLSSLKGIPADYVPPANTKAQQSSASAKLDALFNKPQRSPENPYQKALRQTNRNPSSLSQSNPELFLKDLFEKYPSTSTSSGAFGASAPNTSKVEEIMPLRLRPSLGRTQNVDASRGFDVMRALRQVDIKCHANNVKIDSVLQRTHVRRGQRRKMERCRQWVKLFKVGFIEECARVRRMKNQGW